MRKYLIFLFLLFFPLGFIIFSQSRGVKPVFRGSEKAEIITPVSTLLSITPTTSLLSSQRQKVRVTRVIDGDTIEIAGGIRVRYIGIDTAETVDPRKAVQCFGREAASKNKELVEGKAVELEKDVSETDRYGRLLRYIYVPSTDSASSLQASSGQEGEIFVNDYLVRQGFALASSYPPDIKYQDQFRQAEQEARENGRGLWTGCRDGKKQSSDTCQIKGNISSKGEKIYHLPECPYWSKTVINEERGERWFCSEDEAQSAGWRKAKNCL